MTEALLVIDVQLGCFDGELCEPMFDGATLIDNVNTAIAIARTHGLPVIFIQHSNPHGHALAPDTNGWQLHPKLHRLESDRIVQKRASDGFENTDLGDVLTSMNVDTILNCGLQSEFCITNTSLGALQSGRQVIVIKDAHGTEGSSANKIIQRQNTFLAGKGAIVLALAELDDWLRAA